MHCKSKELNHPIILSPAGNKASFLAALAGGADAIYCGLKQFSARMDADNFSLSELSKLSLLSEKKGVKIYITLNTLIKPDEIGAVASLIKQLSVSVKPHALIFQDLAIMRIARDVGYQGELHLSTLANVSFPKALNLIGAYRISTVVLPRELSIDEIKQFAAMCPPTLKLEVFVHGALCYGVSGRCYWSSFLGGKSGLRGRCVQPCRRLYHQSGQKKRFFSCQDFSFDVLAKLLLAIPQISAWKIEGRKKGPHYVYYTTYAYRLLRDHIQEPNCKKEALAFLDMALGRKTTHYNILPQRPQEPVQTNVETGSGLLVGTLKGGGKKPYFSPRLALLKGDLLRIGYEDGTGHTIIRVSKPTPARGRLYIQRLSKNPRANNSPIFLLDRREKNLTDALNELEKQLEMINSATVTNNAPAESLSNIQHRMKRKKETPLDLHVHRLRNANISRTIQSAWMEQSLENIRLSPKAARKFWWWLPPVIWPIDDAYLTAMIKKFIQNGCRNFVLNMPWQISLFSKPKSVNLWAGPFCNIANAVGIDVVADMGISGVIISPEMARKDIFELASQSALPLGIIISGNFPFCVARPAARELKSVVNFTSPKGEQGWIKKYDSNVWVYPNWTIDLNAKKGALQKAGYSLFVHLIEPVPNSVSIKKRPGLWNWNIGLK